VKPNRRIWVSSKWLVFKRPSLAGFERPLTLRLRFAEVDNAGTLQLGVDNVAFQAVPEPSSLVMAGLGASLCLGYNLLKKRRWRGA
jgi:PEP-CTERM motif